MAAPKTKRGTSTEHAEQPVRSKSNVQAERDQNHMEAAQADLVDDECMEELAGKLDDCFNFLLPCIMLFRLVPKQG